MKVGTIVLLTVPMLGNNRMTIGVCYETYGSGGASFIFENGEFDGFSSEEQKAFLFEVDFSPIIQTYTFISVPILSTDWRYGRFDSALSSDDIKKGSYISKMRDSKIDSII